MSKAQLSLTTIGIAILVLITVVVIAAITTGFLGDFGTEISDIKNKFTADYCSEVNALRAEGSSVHGSVAAQCPGTTRMQIKDGNFLDVPDGQLCCVCQDGRKYEVSMSCVA